MNKAELRQQLRRARASLGAPARSIASRRIVQHVRALPELQQAECVGMFWPIRHEVDLRPLLDHASPGALGLPVVTAADAPLTFRDGSGPLEPGPFGVRAPGPTAADLPLERLDLLLMPALGVDALGRRIGYGGGYYDRTLAECPSLLRFAVVFHAQVARNIPTESHDLPLHGYITERGVFRVASSAAL